MYFWHWFVSSWFLPNIMAQCRCQMICSLKYWSFLSNSSKPSSYLFWFILASMESMKIKEKAANVQLGPQIPAIHFDINFITYTLLIFGRAYKWYWTWRLFWRCLHEIKEHLNWFWSLLSPCWSHPSKNFFVFTLLFYHQKIIPWLNWCHSTIEGCNQKFLIQLSIWCCKQKPTFL